MAACGFAVALAMTISPAYSQQKHQKAAPAVAAPRAEQERCDIPEGVGHELMGTVQRTAAIAQQSMPVLNQLKEVTAGATKPEAPLADQLTTREAGRFSELTQRLKAMQLLELVESRRERDIHVLNDMIIMADQNYRFGKEVAEADPNYIVWLFLNMMRFTAEKSVSDLMSAAQDCNIDRSLWLMANRELSNSKIDYARMNALLAELKPRYGFSGPINRDKLTQQDKIKYDAVVRDVVTPMNHLLTFINDIEHIRAANRVSVLIYENDRNDVAISGGSMDALGSSIQKMVEEQALPKESVILVGLWRKVGDKIPPPMIKELEQIQGYMQKYLKQ